MKTIHGTCSCCGGPVTSPFAQWSTVPMPPSCERCGAVPREAFGPVIETERRKTINTPGELEEMRQRGVWPRVTRS